MFQRPDRIDNTLYIVSVVFNPVRYRSRWRLYQDFAKHVEETGKAKLLTVEIAHGEREFTVTEPGERWHLQLRTQHEIWHKERAINLGVQRLPADWRYVAWVDADVQFARGDWADEALHALQSWPVVQLWSEASDMSAGHEIVQTHKSFAWCYWNDDDTTPLPVMVKKGYGGWDPKTRKVYWHPGFGHAYRRDAWDALGGLFDLSIIGAGDYHMAQALIGQAHVGIDYGIHQEYKDAVLLWQKRAVDYIKGNYGYVSGHISHYWHGPKADRKYNTRWKILVDNGFQPSLDLRTDWQGLYQLTDRVPKLRRDIQKYFRQRNEDQL